MTGRAHAVEPAGERCRPLNDIARAARWSNSARTAVRPPLTVRRARGAQELDAFATGYCAVSGYRVDERYLSRSRVFVAVRDDRLVGGFVLNVDPPFRTRTRMPASEQRRLAHEFPSQRTVELACVWLAKEARGGLSSASLWACVVWHASRQGRPRVVFGTEVERLSRLYARTGARLLYEGEVCVDGHVRHGWIYAVSRGRWPYVMLRLVALPRP
jgi:hypothetical protein